MITFKRKEFALPVIGLVASTGAGIGISAVQGKIHHNQDMEQQERFNSKQMKEQSRQNAALEKIAKQAEKNPALAQQAAGVIQQKSYAAVPNKTFLQKAGTVVYDFGRELAGKGGKTAINRLGTGLAMGTTMAAGGYLVDKAIQADRKRITGSSLPESKQLITPEEKNKKKKTLAKVGAGALATAAAIYGAKKGALGSGFKNLYERATATGAHAKGVAGANPINWKNTAKNLGKEYKSGFKEQFVNINKETGKVEGINLMGTAMTVAFPAAAGISYIPKRKQLKEQAEAQQKQYTENYQYQNGYEEKKGLSKGAKAAIGIGTAVATIAAGRRGAFGAKAGRYLNDWYMSRGRQIGKLNKSLGEKMMKSGAEQYGRLTAKMEKDSMNAAIKAGQRASSGKKSILERAKELFGKGRSEQEIKELVVKGNDAQRRLNMANFDNMAKISGRNRLSDIKSGRVHTSFTKSIASGISKFYGTGGSKGTMEFLDKMKNSSNAETKKVANFLSTGTGQTLASVGAIGVGSLAFKPWEWGDKAVRGAAGAVDKRAFAYEKSQNQEI